MARKDRTGERRTREQRSQKRIPQMGYYLVVTDTEATERCYFTGLHDSLPENIREKLVIRVIETKTRDLVQRCLKETAYEAQYRIPWIVFDRDRVEHFDEIIEEAERKDIHVGWSNPCFEIWMFAYFGQMPYIEQSWTCCDRFGEKYEKETGMKYSKADETLYRRLLENGDEEKAIELARRNLAQRHKDGERKPSTMCPCTTVYELVEEIRGKAKQLNP